MSLCQLFHDVVFFNQKGADLFYFLWPCWFYSAHKKSFSFIIFHLKGALPEKNLVSIDCLEIPFNFPFECYPWKHL